MEKKEKDSEEKVEEEDLSEIDEIIEKLLSVKGYVIFQDILHNNNYHSVYEHGVNRYYVSDENSYLDEKFVPWPELAIEYCVFHADLMYCC